MREIRFRGKIFNGDWVYGVPFPTVGGVQMLTFAKGDCFYVDPETVGQYTGIKDENGQEIYEGDIVYSPLYKRRYEVGFRDGSWAMLCPLHNVYLYPMVLARVIEVVGNIHEKEKA